MKGGSKTVAQKRDFMMNLIQIDSCTFRSIEDMLVGAIDFAFMRLAKRNGLIDGEVLHIVRHSLGDVELHKHIQSSQGCKHRIEQLIKSRLDSVECPSLTVLMRQAGGVPPHQDIVKTSAHMKDCKYCRMEIEFLRKLLPSNSAELNRLYVDLWGDPIRSAPRLIRDHS